MARRRAALPRVVVLGAAIALVAGLAAVVLAVDEGERPAYPPATTAGSRAVRLLRAWDHQRARAFADGRGDALSALYVAGSRTGADDRSVLERYRRRGLTVTAMTTQLLAVTVLSQSSHRIELRVTDVLVDAVVTDRRGIRRTLPRDRPSTRRVVLVNHAGRWLVDEAYPAD